MTTPELDQLVADAHAELDQARVGDYTSDADFCERLAAAHERIVDAYQAVYIALCPPTSGALHAALIDAQVLHVEKATKRREGGVR